LQAWLAQASQSVMQFTEMISLLNLYALKTRSLRLLLGQLMGRSKKGPGDGVWPGPNSHDGNGGHPCTRHSHPINRRDRSTFPANLRRAQSEPCGSQCMGWARAVQERPNPLANIQNRKRSGGIDLTQNATRAMDGRFRYIFLAPKKSKALLGVSSMESPSGCRPSAIIPDWTEARRAAPENNHGKREATD
jgi:hypothetical protein